MRVEMSRIAVYVLIALATCGLYVWLFDGKCFVHQAGRQSVLVFQWSLTERVVIGLAIGVVASVTVGRLCSTFQKKDG